MVGQHGFRAADCDDLEQELALHAYLATPGHDGRLGALSTYYEHVLSNKATDLALHNTRQCRDRRREVPLELAGELAAPPERRAVTADLRLDLPLVLSGLPEADGAVALALAGHSVAEVSRRTGRSRQSVRSAAKRVRRHLERCGVSR